MLRDLTYKASSVVITFKLHKNGKHVKNDVSAYAYKVISINLLFPPPPSAHTHPNNAAVVLVPRQ